jgi:hypothetical protein
MALFGAPLAREDHALRGAYAALRLRDTITRYAAEFQRTAGVPVQIREALLGDRRLEQAAALRGAR